jgi:hypothetical protein
MRAHILALEDQSSLHYSVRGHDAEAADPPATESKRISAELSGEPETDSPLRA